ncbi:MAG TPA: chemotaxis response regulator protein-glutamate methylesterase [Gemmatimonadaceae bacterium]|nr:chemotaxis response regulator protein-glutamate methylesterase [Gemmatimonadaceae bacterium]
MTAAPKPTSEERVRVLVVDDSAVAREVLATLLRRDGLDVDVTTSAETALQRIQRSRPDVVVLDLHMPGMGGLELLERIMRDNPLPVVICSAIAQPGARAAIRALELGAIDVIPKPKLGVRAMLDSSDVPVSHVVRGAATAKTRRLGVRAQEPTLLAPTDKPAIRSIPWNGNAIAIGASTGGTEALRLILTQLPPDCPPVAVVQHMPGAFTPAFAQRLDSLCAVEVREARDGDLLSRGLALIAPGGRQMEIVSSGGLLRVRVTPGPTVSGHCPSVDVLFRSASRALGSRAVGVLLTGMGADGAEGLLELRHDGAHTIAQDETTSVVWGMPGEAVALGAATEVIALECIAPAMLAAAGRRARVTLSSSLSS